MSDATQSGLTRREMFKNTGKFAAAAALTNAILPGLYAAESNTIQLALVGCGGRGTGAAVNALSTKSGPTKLVAMADVFPKKLADSYKNLKADATPSKIDVPEDRKFVGFDGYKKAMDCLNPGDVVIMATPPAFRWVHFNYAIDKGLNVFMEKPTTVDGPTTRKMLDLADEVGRQELEGRRRPDVPALRSPQELHDRIKKDEIGDIMLHAGVPLPGPDGPCLRLPKPADIRASCSTRSKSSTAFLWASGGCLQRLPDPQHRRMLLDEGRLAGRSQGLRRTAIIAATTSTRTSTPTRPNTPSPTAPSCCSKDAASKAAIGNSPATPTARRVRP